MTHDTTAPTIGQLVDEATGLVEARIPLILLQHGLKAPIKGPDGSWLIVTEPEVVESAIVAASQRRPANLGGVLTPKMGSPLIVVDDVGPEASGKLEELEVSGRDDVWIQRTGRGNRHFFFYCDDIPPPRVIRAEGLPVDLLSDGYVVLPPSNTYLESKGGGPYRWMKGHSPADIPLAELPPPPAVLLQWWAEQAHKAKPRVQDNTGKPKAWQLLRDTIPEGCRNATLTQIGGWLRLYHPAPVVETLLLAINDARCQPSLGAEEVKAIVKSIARYVQPGVNGHPRAVVPSFRRREVARD